MYEITGVGIPELIDIYVAGIYAERIYASYNKNLYFALVSSLVSSLLRWGTLELDRDLLVDVEFAISLIGTLFGSLRSWSPGGPF